MIGYFLHNVKILPRANGRVGTISPNAKAHGEACEHADPVQRLVIRS
jgi:hypothetical protein